MTPNYPTRIAAALASALAFTAPALADDKPVLTVYTYDSFVTDYGPGPVIEERFEATCGCDLSFIAAGDGHEAGGDGAGRGDMGGGHLLCPDVRRLMAYDTGERGWLGTEAR